jgi:hypothetical protein
MNHNLTSLEGPRWFVTPAHYASVFFVSNDHHGFSGLDIFTIGDYVGVNSINYRDSTRAKV